MRVAFWGTGDTARKSLWKIKRLSDRTRVVAFTDKDHEGMEGEAFWEGYRVTEPQMLARLDLDYLCILSVWEWEIRKKIYKDSLFDLSKIISLPELCMLDSSDLDLDRAYEQLLKNVPPRQEENIERWRVYEYLKRKYSYVLCESRYWQIEGVPKASLGKGRGPVWICWLQGLKQAPELVKVCVHSVERALRGKEDVVILDWESLSAYIDMPDHMVRKWKEGKIGNTHFSDLIRVRLLNTYGGVWLDATVYFTGNELPDYIRDNDLFLFNFRPNWRNYTEPKIAASWLIAAKPETKLLLVLEALLNEYWKKEDKQLDYFLFHLFLTMAAECFPEEWDKFEVVLRDPAQLLGGELLRPYDNRRFEQLKRMSDIHKLSYKIPYAAAEEDSVWAKLYEWDKKWRE